jgi:hypothetical protein
MGVGSDCRLQDRRLYLLLYGKRGSLFIVIQREAVLRLKCPQKGDRSDAITVDTSYTGSGMME